jgi:hypothetical protein
VLLFWLHRLFGQLNRRIRELLEVFQVNLGQVKDVVIKDLLMVWLEAIFGISVLIFIESDRWRLYENLHGVALQ